MVDLMCVYGMAGIGVFWCIIEQLYQSGGQLPIASYKSIAFSLHVECTLVASVVQDFGLFKNDGTMFWSESAMKRMTQKREVAEKRKQAANARWNSNANAMQLDSETDANAMQKNAIKDIKDKRDIKEKVEKESSVREPRFTPPTLDDVKQYVSEKGYDMDPVKFWNFYESKGWMVGKNKMKKWKAAVANWASGEKPRHQPTASGGRGHDGIKHCNDEWA